MTWSRTGFSKHATRAHECTCGKTIYGNAYFAHRVKCAPWLKAEGIRRKMTVSQVVHDEAHNHRVHPNCEWCSNEQEVL